MSLLASWLASPPPDAAVEIAPTHVSAATVEYRREGVVVRSYAVETLTPGAVEASLGSQNIVDRPAVTAAVRTVLERLETRTARVALVIPDLAAKVSIVHFDDVPPRRDDLDQLVRWQVRKSAPFPIDDASVTYSPGVPGADGGAEFVVALARRDVVEEYEGVCGDAGTYAGLVDLSTFSMLNLVLAGAVTPTSDCLVVHVRPEYTSIAIIRGGAVAFFRNRPEGGDETLADLVHQTAMYYQDRLSGEGFARVLLGGSGREAGAVEETRRNLQERLGATVEPINAPIVEGGSAHVGVVGAVADILAPLTGMLLRAQQEAVGV
ncbi:MAG: pilus assembly protein PilM [Acidobacteria bacterium]|nr:pilus assembly protein PilM [Acidobacteriota bacterium]